MTARMKSYYVGRCGVHGTYPYNELSSFSRRLMHDTLHCRRSTSYNWFQTVKMLRFVLSVFTCLTCAHLISMSPADLLDASQTVKGAWSRSDSLLTRRQAARRFESRRSVPERMLQLYSQMHSQLNADDDVTVRSFYSSQSAFHLFGCLY